ncbi:phosphatase PAP2 family protein [Legionella genomosp. 1]|uniref:phosphatase PAP2 family protein n=1 Tax=Legionella genomosp. 1 TaxID=1093625 RepID=UPI001054DCE3|nr:phosphatase PAP2 family protein [Legionella genomosp. 1]
MPTSKFHHSCLLLQLLLLFSFASIAFAINCFFYQFPGNNYFPEGSAGIGISLLLMLAGCRLLLNKNHHLVKIIQEILLFYIVMSLIAFTTNAVQFTPFPPIDRYIIAFENQLGIALPEIVSWTNHHPWFKNILGLCYDTLPYQLGFLPLLVIAAGQFEKIRRFFSLLLISSLIGFAIYYFFPTVAPAAMYQTDEFAIEQLATGIKFNQLHQHIPPDTIQGGMVAFPSFHTFWAWYCLELMCGWPIAFSLLLIINTLLILSCVLLGWHYPLDILGAFLIIWLSNYLYTRCNKYLPTLLHSIFPNCK